MHIYNIHTHAYMLYTCKRRVSYNEGFYPDEVLNTEIVSHTRTITGCFHSFTSLLPFTSRPKKKDWEGRKEGRPEWGRDSVLPFYLSPPFSFCFFIIPV